MSLILSYCYLAVHEDPLLAVKAVVALLPAHELAVWCECEREKRGLGHDDVIVEAEANPLRGRGGLLDPDMFFYQIMWFYQIM